MHALIVRFDRLSTAYLGCYGNAWIKTPHLDAFAARGIVFDQCFAEDMTAAVAELAGTPPPVAPLPSGVSALVQAGVHVTVCTRSELTDQVGSAKIVRVADAEAMASLVPELWSHVGQQPRGVLWLDAPLIADPWQAGECDFLEAWDHVSDGMVLEDAMAKAVERVSSADGPVPEVLRSSGLCNRRSPPQNEAAVRLRRAVYAACVQAIDRWFGQGWESIVSAGPQPGFVIVSARAGDFVGRRDVSDTNCPPLVTELVQVPLLLHTAEESTRSSALVTFSDATATLLEEFGINTTACGFADQSTSLRPMTSGETAEIRDAVYINAGPYGCGLRTPAYSCLTGPAIDPEATQLFIKPDDVWDVLNVAAQHEQLVHEAVQRLRNHRSA